MKRILDRLEDMERNGRGRNVTFNNPPASEEGRRTVSSTVGLTTGSRWTTSSMKEPERRWAASPFCPSVAPRKVQAREGARAVDIPTPTIDDQDRDNDFYDAPNEDRNVDRNFSVNDANVENMVETNTRDDVYDDVLRNEMTEANGRLVVAQRRGQNNELYKLNDERMQLQLQYTQARDIITVANRPYHIIDQWLPQTHH